MRIVDVDDLGVSPEFFKFVDLMWGPHSFDRFANTENAKTKRFSSIYWNPGTSGVDAFTSNWSCENNWLVPPVSLASKTINHLVKCRAKGTLVVPRWPSAPFWPLLFNENLGYKEYVEDVLEFYENERIFVPGHNLNSIFANGKFSGTVLAKTFVTGHGIIWSSDYVCTDVLCHRTYTGSVLAYLVTGPLRSILFGHWTFLCSPLGDSWSLGHTWPLEKIFSSGFWNDSDSVQSSELKRLLFHLRSTVIDSRAKTTVSKYANGFKRFLAWAQKYPEIDSILPASELYVSLYLQHLMQTVKHYSSVETAFYSIKWAHKLANLVDPCESDLVRSIVESSKRILNRPVQKKEPIDATIIKTLFNRFCNPRTLRDLRLLSIWVPNGREYESNDIAENDEDEKKIRQAETRALKTIKEKKTRPQPYTARPTPAVGNIATATAPPPAYDFSRYQQPFRTSTARREPCPMDICHYCKQYGHWRRNCPLNFKSATASAPSYQPSQQQ
ncbi:Hypothetical predicted protein [Mytilus galloprovincialis]|uniref:CCHC-type domain-containing protein n=1 Tax=Mytilus galloprovincialis TaxID=29158 RepID=A0A8B6FXP6_MYTGA|nr:Hypothetical predicted protein [Mytilus galloprovincialis]